MCLLISNFVKIYTVQMILTVTIKMNCILMCFYKTRTGQIFGEKFVYQIVKDSYN